jgi:hypothetical protein
MNSESDGSWQWGNYSLNEGETLEIRLGNLHGKLTRLDCEWDLDVSYAQDHYVQESNQATRRTRTVVAKWCDGVVFEPATADRNVVARPAQTIQVPPGERTTLFITTPLWLKCKIKDTVIADIPLEIMSDSWFGTNTRVGEVCYSNETRAQVSLDELQVREGRLITPVTIVNNGEDPVVIDRLSLPLPLLTIYRTTNQVWTQSVTFTRTGELDTATIQLRAVAPEFIKVERTSPPRSPLDPNLMERALGILFK